MIYETEKRKQSSFAAPLGGEQKIWLFLAIFLSAVSGLCIIVPYIGIYRLMDATFNHTCTQELVVHTVVMIAVAVTLRFALFGCSGVRRNAGGLPVPQGNAGRIDGRPGHLHRGPAPPVPALCPGRADPCGDRDGVRLLQSGRVYGGSTLIYRTGRCASRCGPASAPAHRPLCGR